MIEDMLSGLVPEKFIMDERYRTGHVRIINALPGRRIMGVHIPEMTALADELVRREDALSMIEAFVRAAEEESATGRRDILTHEEMMVWGMMINRLKPSCLALPEAERLVGSLKVSQPVSRTDLNDRLLDLQLELMRQYVPHIDNWAVCDHVSSAAKWFAKAVSRSLKPSLSGSLGKKPTGSPESLTSGKGLSVVSSRNASAGELAERLWRFLCGYFDSDREFEVRFAVVMSMCHFMNEEYLPRIFFRFDALDFGKIQSEYQSPYYVRMGVAWCLATALAKFPDETRAYLRHSRLPQDVIRLYVRKARESFRTRDISPF